MKKITVIIERPNGTTYSQEIENRGSVIESVKYFQIHTLGNPYKWRTNNGKKERYIDKNAYLVVNYYVD